MNKLKMTICKGKHNPKLMFISFYNFCKLGQKSMVLLINKHGHYNCSAIRICPG